MSPTTLTPGTRLGPHETIALLAMAIPAVIHLRETLPSPPPSVRFQIPPPGTSAAEMFTLSDGYLVFRREDTLMAQPFDLKALKLTGEMFPIAAEVPVSVNSGFGAYSVSASGALAYRTGGIVSNRALVWMDRAGKRLGTVGKPGAFRFKPRLSPDETTVAVVIVSSSQSDLWLQKSETGRAHSIHISSRL